MGFLEHHKDYVLRAKAHNKKKKKYVKLLRKASLRNAEEYHPAMLKSRLVGGRHVWKEKKKKVRLEEKIESVSADVAYLRMKKRMEEQVSFFFPLSLSLISLRVPLVFSQFLPFSLSTLSKKESEETRRDTPLGFREEREQTHCLRWKRRREEKLFSWRLLWK